MRVILMILCVIAGMLWMPLTAGAWLENKPENYTTVLTDYSFDAVIPTGPDQPMGDGSGWNVYYPTAARTTKRIVDTTGAVSPQHSVETLYETGDNRGVGKVKFYRSAASSITEFYVSIRVKWDSNYEWHPLSNKLLFLEPGNILLQSRYIKNGTQWYNSFLINGTAYLPFNNMPIPLGEWVTIEFIMKRSATAGEFHVWLNGVKTLEQTGINVPTTSSSQTLDINDTWGGDGVPRSRQSQRWIDHVYIAVPGDSNNPPPAAPAELRVVP